MIVEVGCSYPDQTLLESDYGQLDRLRVYGTGDGINGHTIESVQAVLQRLTSNGQKVDVSCAFKNSKGIFKATDIYPGKMYDALWKNYAAAMASLPLGSKIVFRHEEDAKAAAQSGTYPQLNDAEQYIAQLCYATPNFAAVSSFGVCWTGFDIAIRDPALRPSLYAAEFLAIDLPYLNPGAHWQTFDQMAGLTVDYVNAHETQLPLNIWEYGCDPRPGRAAWFADMANSILTNPRYSRLESLIYWNGGAYTLTPTDAKALATAYKKLSGKA